MTVAEIDSERALRIARQHATHSSTFLAFNDLTRHFLHPEREALVAYRLGGRRQLLQLTGPVAAADERERVLDDFVDWAHRQGRRITAVQLTADDARLYAARGFVVNQLGCSYGLELTHYSLRGRRFVKTRNMINHARRRGVTVEETTPAAVADGPLGPELDRIDASWLRGKGRLVKELSFMIGERGGRGAAHRRLFVARHDGQVVGYVSFSPVWGPRPGWLYDLTRRGADAPPGTIETVFDEAAVRMRDESAGWLHLGLTPFSGLSSDVELPGHSRVVSTVTGLVAEHGAAVYPARTQLAFKNKWAPSVAEPEYVAFDRRVGLGALWQLLRVTNIV